MIDDYARIMETNREIEREEAEWHTQKIAELRVFLSNLFGQDVQQLIQKNNFLQVSSRFSKGDGKSSFSSDPQFSISTNATIFQPNGFC